MLHDAAQWLFYYNSMTQKRLKQINKQTNKIHYDNFLVSFLLNYNTSFFIIEVHRVSVVE